MNQLLERTYAEVAQFAEPDQDIVATLILEEIEDERRWQCSFAQSPDVLTRLAEHRAQASATH